MIFKKLRTKKFHDNLTNGRFQKILKEKQFKKLTDWIYKIGTAFCDFNFVLAFSLNEGGYVWYKYKGYINADHNLAIRNVEKFILNDFTSKEPPKEVKELINNKMVQYFEEYKI